MKLELHKTLVWVKNLFFRQYNNKKGSPSMGTHCCINGATVRDRTADLSITNALLYQLSYGGTSFVSLLCL
jgi:hypothetical protein